MILQLLQSGEKHENLAYGKAMHARNTCIIHEKLKWCLILRGSWKKQVHNAHQNLMSIYIYIYTRKNPLAQRTTIYRIW